MQTKKIFTMAVMALAVATAALPLRAADTQDRIPAFPGAEGYGRYVTGGRGGAVYHVTKLNDDGSEGTLRWACDQKGVRTIVFDVSGTIQLQKELKLKRGDVTIAGQTAPGDGICVAGYPFSIGADNVIIRFIRFRVGNENVAHHEGDGLGGTDRKDIIIDHCSVSWSIDECLSVYGCRNTTVQWCIVSQSLVNAGHVKGKHGYGGNWGGSGASYHHNLLAHHDSRAPRLGPRLGTQQDERMDMRNNVIYNWAGNGCYGGEGMNVNIVNNYYKPGPATFTRNQNIQQRIASPGVRTVDYCIDKNKIASAYNTATGSSITSKNIKGKGENGKCYVTINDKDYEIDMTANTINVGGKQVAVAWKDWAKMLHVWCKLYVDGNYNPNSKKLNADNFKYGVAEQISTKSTDGTYPGDDALKLSTPIEYVYTTTHTAKDAYNRVLDYAGASLHRDDYDAIMVRDARKGEASFTGSGNAEGLINSQEDVEYADGSTGWPILKTDDAPKDTDGDGIPDEWETAHGLNPNDKADGAAITESGYTNLELYMNSLVNDIMEKGNQGGTPMQGTQTTGIASVIDSLSRPLNRRVYNMLGMEVNRPLGKGLYICGGKKFTVR